MALTKFNVNHGITLSIFLCILILPAVQSLTCYKCIYAVNHVEDWCVNEPWNATVGSNQEDCPGGQCFVERTVQQGVIYSLNRGCDPTKSRTGADSSTGNKVVVCEGSDLCNDDDLTYVPPTTTPTTTVSTTPPGPTTTRDPKSIYCYSCGKTETCIKAPTRWVLCDPGYYCYVKKMTETETGNLHDFGRGCMTQAGKDQLKSEGCDNNVPLNTCHTFCQTNYCNTGDGTPTKAPPGGQGERAQPLGALVLVSVLASLLRL